MSSLKHAAVLTALRRMNPSATLRVVKTASGVPEQPVGEEVVDGARNRARAAQATYPWCWAIGIENGIREVDGHWEDWAVLVLRSANGAESLVYSRAVRFPTETVEEARRRGFATTTVGSVLAEQHGIPGDDPHSFLTHGETSRQAILEEALLRLLNIPTHHTITIGSVTRILPIREVAPGVRVALFNILGDWELTEAIGVALAKRIPEGVQALFMPDGKAQALLHVMGRESGLPTFVARKEQKPYMTEPVISVRVKSITTANEQCLYLGADDVLRLQGRRVAVVDDVVSTGGTLKAIGALLERIGATPVAVMAAFTEGGERSDVIALGNLPLF